MRRPDAYRRAMWVSWALAAAAAASAAAFAWPAGLAGPDLVVLGLYVLGLLALEIVGVLAGRSPRTVASVAGLALALPAALVVLGGAPRSPLAALYAVPVAIAAAVLGRTATLWMLGLASAAAIVLPLADFGAVTAVTLGTALVNVALFGLVAWLIRGTFVPAADATASGERDPLTQLYGFEAFRRLAERAHDRAVASGSGYGLLVIDIDNLKSVNDSYGHGVGNKAIALVAGVLKRLTRSTDVVGRYGGGKFIVMLCSAGANEVEEIARRIRNVVHATTLESAGVLVRLKASVGVATYPGAGRTLDALMSRAESDMHEERTGREPPKKKPVFRRRSGKMR